jgi:hypothetical protein
MPVWSEELQGWVVPGVKSRRNPKTGQIEMWNPRKKIWSLDIPGRPIPIDDCALCMDPIFRGDRWVRDKNSGARFCCKGDAYEVGLHKKDLEGPGLLTRKEYLKRKKGRR